MIDIEQPHGICSYTCVMDDFSELLLHPAIFLIQDSRSA